MFATAISMALAFWIVTAFVYGREALISLIAFIGAVVIGANRGAATLRLERETITPRRLQENGKH
jgi:hypothetical protein